LCGFAAVDHMAGGFDEVLQRTWKTITVEIVGTDGVAMTGQMFVT
jgi:hypothetical protein